jgi:hypothetical protein
MKSEEVKRDFSAQVGTLPRQVVFPAQGKPLINIIIIEIRRNPIDGGPGVAGR